MSRKNSKGVSLLEILVVVSIFAVLGIMATRAVLLTLRGTQRSDSSVRVRENLSYGLSVIERQLRNASGVTACPNPDENILSYEDSLGGATSFSCVNEGSDGYIASGSARLTSDEISVTSCSFVCSKSETFLPAEITVELTAEDRSATGVEKQRVTTSSTILLRSY